MTLRPRRVPSATPIPIIVNIEEIRDNLYQVFGVMKNHDNRLRKVEKKSFDDQKKLQGKSVH